MTAAAWRGCCLEIFSRAERSIDDCIASLEKSGRCVGRDAHHQGSRARRKALAQYLEGEQFSAHCSASVRKLDAWGEKEADRVWFAHGLMIVRDGEIRLSLRTHDGKAGTAPATRTFNPIQMLAFLKQLEASQRALHQQLGHIRAVADKKAVKPA